MRRVSRLSGLMCALALFTACSSDDTPVQPQTPTITVAATTASATAARGSSASYPITVGRGGGFTGAVALTATGVPTGVTATFTPASLATGVTASSLSLAVGATAAAGTSTITITASGTGVTSQTATVSLVVPSPAITLVAGSATATIVQGATTTIPVTITRTNGFTGAIDIGVTGLPAGVTAGALSIADGATTGTLTLTATGAAAATTTPVNITLTASGTGVTAQTATVALTVAAATTPGFTVTAAPAALAAVAGQGGTSTITLARTGGFAANVALAVEGAPTGVTATLNPTSLAGAATTSTLTITSTAATVPGTYNLTVRGTSAGQTDRTTVVAFTVNAAPGITIALAPAALSVAQSASATSTITLTRLGGYTGDVNFSTTGLPTGATIAFAPATLTGATTTTVATITAGAATAVGTSNVVITGTGNGAGVPTSVATLALTVTTPPSITVAASNATAAQGATATSTVTLTRLGGFAGAVGLAVTGLPAGVTATFNPASVTGTTSTLSLAVASNVVASTYTGTITASGTGVPNATGTFTLTVTTPGTGGGNVVYQFCTIGNVPTFFAYRNGSTGNWVPVTQGANNSYSFSLSASIGQVAYAIPNGEGGTSVTVLSNAASEFPTAAVSVCPAAAATKTVTGTVAGLAAGSSATVSLGGASATVQANGAFTITGAASGASDLVATRSAFNATTFAFTVDRVIVRRNLNPANNASVGAVLDFGAAEAVAPASAAYTVTGANGEQVVIINSFTTPNGGAGSLFTGLNVANPVQVLGVPSNLTVAGDLHQLLVSATTSAGSVVTSRSVIQYNRDVTARTIALGGAAPTAAFSTSATMPYARIRAQGTVPSEYLDFVTASYVQGSNARSWSHIASRAFLGAGTANYDLDLPDLSGVAGFNNAWGLLAGTATQSTITVYSGFNAFTVGAENASVKLASRTVTYSP